MLMKSAANVLQTKANTDSAFSLKRFITWVERVEWLSPDTIAVVIFREGELSIECVNRDGGDLTEMVRLIQDENPSVRVVGWDEAS